MNKWKNFEDMPQRLHDGDYVVPLSEDDYNLALACVRACQGVSMEKVEPYALLNAIDGLMIARADVGMLRQRETVTTIPKVVTNAERRNLARIIYNTFEFDVRMQHGIVEFSPAGTCPICDAFRVAGLHEYVVQHREV